MEGIYRLRQQIRQYQIGMKLSKQKKRLELAIKLYVEMSLQSTMTIS